MPGILIGIRIGGNGGVSWDMAANYISALSVVSTSDTEQTITATIVGVDYDGVSFEYSLNGGSTWSAGITDADGILNQTGLTEDTLYQWRARLYKGSNFGTYSPTASDVTFATKFYDGNTIAWYDKNAASTITKDGSNRVALWKDRLLSGHDLAQTDDAKKPIWSDLLGLTFDGENDFMLASTGTLAQPIMVYALIKNYNWTTDDHFWASKTGNYYSMNLATKINIGQFLQIIAGSGWVCDKNIMVGSFVPFDVITALYKGASSLIKVDGTAGAAGNPGTSGITSFELGGSTGYSIYGLISCREFAIRKVDDTGADEAKIMGNIKKRYLHQVAFDTAKLLITFDNTHGNVYDDGYPLFTAKGVHVTLFGVATEIGTGACMTWAECVTMHNAGHDIQCHTNTHTDLRTLNQAQVLAEYQAVNDAFVLNGLPIPQHTAYPFGYKNDNVKAWTGTMRLTARDYTGSLSSLVEQYKDLEKLQIQSMATDGMTAGGLTAFKLRMDKAVTNKGLLMTIGHSIDDISGTSIANLTAIIDYAASIGMEVITISELYALLDL